MIQVKEPTSDTIQQKINKSSLLYVNLRHGLRTSHFLVPEGIETVHVIIEGEEAEETVEFLDRYLQPFQQELISYSGIALKMRSFEDRCARLRFSNGRTLSISFDKTPGLYPSFYWINNTAASMNTKEQ